MQPQGLEALMQSQPAPQMNNPRLAAAMDVVTSDAEEQILDPRTLAMLKYKDALQAMQAADQMMASAQPAPTPPTVAERTKLAAEQGIAGLAQRLSPGVQQRGGQMAAQQAQQAMQGGGLPQLSAPNMAGMAGGGIIGQIVDAAKGAAGSIFGKQPSYDETLLLNQLVTNKINRLKNEGVLSEEGYTAAQKLLTGGADNREAHVGAILKMNDVLDTLASEAPIPNMAGMAGGGIVAFADGGAPTPTKVVPRPVPMGQPSVETQAAVSDDVARYIYNYTNLRASMEAATDPQQKAVINQRLQEMQRTFSPDIVSEAHMKMSQQSGMAGGGIVGFAEGKEVEGAPTPTNLGTPEGAREWLRKELATRQAPEQLAEAQKDLSRLQIVASQLPEQRRGEVDRTIKQLSQRISELGGVPNEESFAPSPLARQPNIFNVGIDSPRAQQEFRMEGVRDQQAQSRPSSAMNTGIASALRGPTIASPSAATSAVLEAMRARDANQEAPVQEPDPLAEFYTRQMSIDPKEVARTSADRLTELTGVKELIEQRRVEQERLRALDEAQFSPEKERSRLLRAALASGAERGLGGFGMGYAAEEGAIANERRTSQQRAIADMDKTIAELRAMGLSLFEAENVARAGAEAKQQTAATELENRRAAQILADAEMENSAAQRRSARDIAEIGGTTNEDTLLRIYTEQFMQEGKSRQESEYLAAQRMQENELARAAAMRVPTDPRLADFERQEALEKLRVARYKSIELLASRDPTAYKAEKNKIDIEINALIASIGGDGPAAAGNSGSRFSVEQVN